MQKKLKDVESHKVRLASTKQIDVIVLITQYPYIFLLRILIRIIFILIG